MPLENFWYEPDKVFITYMTGVITLNDLTLLADLWSPLVEAYQGKTVHNITDVSRVERFDINLLDLRNAFGRFEKNRLAGWVIISGNSNAAIRFMITVISQMMGFKFRLLLDLEAGLAFLNEQDDSLPPLLPFRHDQSS